MKKAAPALAVGLVVAGLAGAASSASAVALEDAIYGLDWNNGMLTTIDTSTAVMSDVALTNPTIGGSAAIYIDPESGDVIVPTWEGGGPWPVYRVSATDGATVLLNADGPQTTGAATTPGGNVIAYDNAGASTLALMDSATGTYTDLAPATLNGQPARLSSLAYCDGQLYAFTYDDGDAIFALDADSGIMTAVTTATNMIVEFYAADCDSTGRLYVTDGERLLTAASASAPLVEIAGLSGPSYTGWLETMAIYVSADSLGLGGGDTQTEEPPTLAETGPAAPAEVLALAVASLLTAGAAALLIARRRRAILNVR